MKLLVSPMNLKEAYEAISGGADIIDIKNPKEGSLGANFPWVIKDIQKIVPGNVEISAPIGDLAFKPGLATLAAYGLATLGIDYIKFGLYGIANERESLEISKNICRGVRGFNLKVVLAGYADFKHIGSISPLKLPKIAQKAGADIAMIDTAIKNGNGLLDHLSIRELEKFTIEAHGYGLEVALAGSLREKDIRRINEIGADIIGVRGAVCENGDRIKGRVSSDKVRTIKGFLKEDIK